MQAKHKKRGFLRLNDVSCVRVRPMSCNNAWAYDFVNDRTRGGCKIRLLTMIDEFRRECLAIEVKRRLNSQDVLAMPARLFPARGVNGLN